MTGNITRTHLHNGVSNIVELYTRPDGRLDMSISQEEDNEDGCIAGMDIVMTPEDIIALGNWAQVIESVNRMEADSGRGY